jgi:hypothetical protein
MHDFTELDRNINLNKPENYHLSIQLMQDGLSFCILESYIGRYVGAKHHHFDKTLVFEVYLDKVAHMLETEPLLQNKFGSVALMVMDPNAFLIPGAVFNKTEVKTYFEINRELNELEEIHYNHIPCFDAYNVFAAHSELLNLFRNKYKGVGIFHQRTSMLNNKNMEAQTGLRIYVNNDPHFFDLVAVQDNKLIFCNAYTYVTENDFVYFFLNTFKQLRIDPNKGRVFIVGEVDKKARQITLLGKYIKPLEIGTVGEEFSHSPNLSHIAKPYYYNLYNLYRCVSLVEHTRG